MAIRVLLWLGCFTLAFAAARSIQRASARDGATTAPTARPPAAAPATAPRPRSQPAVTGKIHRPAPSPGEPLRVPPPTDFDRELQTADRPRTERLQQLRRAFGRTVIALLKRADCIQVKEHGYRKLQITAQVESRSTTALVRWSGDQLGARVVDGEPLTTAEAACASRVLSGELTLTPPPQSTFESFGGTMAERVYLNQSVLVQGL
jgi:hypothetical protein